MNFISAVQKRFGVLFKEARDYFEEQVKNSRSSKELAKADYMLSQLDYLLGVIEEVLNKSESSK